MYYPIKVATHAIYILTMKNKHVKLYASENVIEEFYIALADNNSKRVQRIHIPKSDVFYVREAVQNHYGRTFTLEHVEWAMRKEGWTDE